MLLKGKCSLKLVRLLKLEPSCTGSSVDEMSLATHKAKKSNNPQNNSELCQFVISEFQPFT